MSTKHKKPKISRIQKKTFRKLRCSPSNNTNIEYSCYTSDALIKLKNYWNARHPDKAIASNDPRTIWSYLRYYMGNVCNTEACWLRQKFIDSKLEKDLLNNTFAPYAPESWKKNPNTWLNSLDIMNVLKQYEKSHPNFKFIGPSPIDFDKRKMYGECVWDELCNFNLKKIMESGKNKIGIVFNLDPHYKSGSHWVSMFIDLKKKFIFYFDSNGDKPKKQFKKLANRIILQAKQLPNPIHLTFDQNHPTRHQRRNTECGVYSLYLIIELLNETKSPEFFKKNKILDDDMEKFRYKYFNHK